MYNNDNYQYIKSVNEGRSFVYGFLAETFSEMPEKNYFEKLKNLAPVLSGMAEKSEDGRLKEGVEDLNRYVDEYSSANEEVQNAIIKNAQEVFKTIQSADIMYQQKYTQTEGVEDMAKLLFDANNVSPVDKYDSVASQMKFMASLAAKSTQLSLEEKKEMEDIIEAQVSLHKKHLNWYNMMTGDMRTIEGANSMYVPMCMIMMGFAKEDFVFLYAVIAELAEEESEGNGN